MRNAFAAHLLTLADLDSTIFLVSGDIGNRLFDEYKASFPDRFLNTGVAEQNMIGVAAGLAESGYHPIVYTIASFATARCYEQIKLDLCYHDKAVTIVGTGAGLSYAALGPTHYSLEDLAIMRVLPNMHVLTPCDTMETVTCLNIAASVKHPSYVRLGKKGEPVIHEAPPDFGLGCWIEVDPGDEVLILGAGTAVSLARNLREQLNLHGISARVASCPSIKPLDNSFLSENCGNYSLIVTVEEHSRIGGFGSAVLEWAEDHNVSNQGFLRLGTLDEFPRALGDQPYTRNALGLNVEQMSEMVVSRISSKS
ncbi:MAG: 1-deoxy-D-xylulose-5-phosphate synthase [Nitrospira sp.]|nr:1-deoxy-D-xylulose-5-phosphate synthase [Nitrospira sp.]